MVLLSRPNPGTGEGGVVDALVAHPFPGERPEEICRVLPNVLALGLRKAKRRGKLDGPPTVAEHTQNLVGPVQVDVELAEPLLVLVAAVCGLQEADRVKQARLSAAVGTGDDDEVL